MQDTQKTPEEVQDLLTKADHLNTAGSLTSMISTALYLFERLFEKQPHKIINGVTLGALVAGIGAMIASVYMKMKAGPYLLYHRQAAGKSEPVTTDAPLQTVPEPMIAQNESVRQNATTPSWVNDVQMRETQASAPQL